MVSATEHGSSLASPESPSLTMAYLPHPMRGLLLESWTRNTVEQQLNEDTMPAAFASTVLTIPPPWHSRMESEIFKSQRATNMVLDLDVQLRLGTESFTNTFAFPPVPRVQVIDLTDPYLDTLWSTFDGDASVDWSKPAKLTVKTYGPGRFSSHGRPERATLHLNCTKHRPSR